MAWIRGICKTVVASVSCPAPPTHQQQCYCDSSPHFNHTTSSSIMQQLLIILILLLCSARSNHHQQQYQSQQQEHQHQQQQSQLQEHHQQQPQPDNNKHSFNISATSSLPSTKTSTTATTSTSTITATTVTTATTTGSAAGSGAGAEYWNSSESEQVLTMLLQSQESQTPKTYLITGATSGIGLEAAKLLLLMNPMNRLILVGRTEQKAHWAVEQVRMNFVSLSLRQPPRGRSKLPPFYNHEHHIIPLVCDHGSFQSVHDCAADLRKKLQKSNYQGEYDDRNGIDVLCLNAATLLPKHAPAQFTEDDIEVTFQTNHLSPFLLVNLIHSLINPGGRVIVTTSGLYLAQTLNVSGIPVYPKTGRAMRNKRFETANGVDFYCKHAYAFSKLCNVAMAVELQERLQPRRIAVASFSPGLITQTGLFRHHRDDLPFQQTRDLMLNEKTVLWGAGALVFMATSPKVVVVGAGAASYWHDLESGKGPDAIYGNDFGPSQVSDAQITKDGRQKLWNLSCDLIGISENTIQMPPPSVVGGSDEEDEDPSSQSSDALSSSSSSSSSLLLSSRRANFSSK